MSDIILMSKPHFEFGSPTAFDPSSLSTSNKIPLPAKAQPPVDIDSQSHSRAIAKIASLERTIERLNQSHASVLKDLHAEVENLQNTISDLTLKKSQRSGSFSSCNDLNSRKVDITEPKSAITTVSSGESQESIYILLQEQKNKYRGIIDRISQDNKRKSNAIELLKNQLDLIKKALSLAGLELDMKELQSLVSNRLKEKADYEKDVEKVETVNNFSEYVPKPPIECDVGKPHFTLPVEPSQIKKSATLQETQSQITKSYIERILNLNRESTLSGHENNSKKENLIKSNKLAKEAPKVSLNYSDSTQEVTVVVEPAKSVFNPKEPLPPIYDEKEAKNESNTEYAKSSYQKESDALEMENPLEAFETASLNRWKNDADLPMGTESQSILELLSGHKSIITNRQKLREKRSKGI